MFKDQAHAQQTRIFFIIEQQEEQEASESNKGSQILNQTRRSQNQQAQSGATSERMRKSSNSGQYLPDMLNQRYDNAPQLPLLLGDKRRL
jgi:hypothetical protein